MAVLPFSLIEFWFPALTVVYFFLSAFLRSFATFSETAATNGHNKKIKLKYFQQQATRSPSILAILNSVALLSIFSHSIAAESFVWRSAGGLFLFWATFVVFFTILEFFQSRLSPKNFSKPNAGVGSTGLFLSLFAPLAYLTATASNFLEFVLPFELMSYLFYLIFLEFRGNPITTKTNPQAQTKALMRGLLYYFWFSFLGTVLLFLAMYLMSVSALSFDFKDLQIFSSEAYSTCSACGVLLLCGVAFKMGGVFFFFFKADLYKLLDVGGTLVFSVYTTFLYLLIFVCLGAQLPFLWWALKYIAGGVIAVATIAFAFIAGFKLSNFYLFVGLSSVLTVLFCILTLA